MTRTGGRGRTVRSLILPFHQRLEARLAAQSDIQLVFASGSVLVGVELVVEVFSVSTLPFDGSLPEREETVGE